MLVNSHDAAGEHDKSQGFCLEVEKQSLSSLYRQGYDNMYSLGIFDLWELSTVLALWGKQNAKDNPLSPLPKDFYLLGIQSNTNLDTAVKGFCRCN